MNISLMVAILGFDVVLLFFVLKLYQTKQTVDKDLLADLASEREELIKMHERIKNELLSLSQGTKDTLNKVTHIAAEVDLEIANCKETIKSQAEQLAEDITQHFETPLSLLSTKQNSLNNVIKTSEKLLASLTKVCQRGEKLLVFLDPKTPTDEILKDLELHKYSKARLMLEKGYSPENIAQKIGLSVAEIRLMNDNNG